eukprot:scaffold50849_cov56-Phaeocystis_antarctica.AAC.1
MQSYCNPTRSSRSVTPACARSTSTYTSSSTAAHSPSEARAAQHGSSRTWAVHRATGYTQVVLIYSQGHRGHTHGHGHGAHLLAIDEIDEIEISDEISDEIGRDEVGLLGLTLSADEDSVPTSAPPPPSKAQPLDAAHGAAHAKPPRPAHLATIHSQKLKLDPGREPPPPGRGGAPEHRAAAASPPRASRRTSLAEAWGLPDGGIDARAHRSSRAASVTTFL